MKVTLRHPRWQRVAVMVAALWWGAITGLAFVAVPMLFVRLGSPAVAGPVAAALFTVVCQLTWVCAAVLAAFYVHFKPPALSGIEKSAILILMLAALAAALQSGWVAQEIVSARATGGNLKLWHSLGSGLVLLQWLLAGATLWRLTRTAPVQG